MILCVPSNPSHSVLLCFYEGSVLVEGEERFDLLFEWM